MQSRNSEEPFARAQFAGVGIGKILGPVRPARGQIQGLAGETPGRLGRPRRGVELMRRGQGRGRCALRAQGPPERGEDLERSARSGFDLPRFGEKRGVEALDLAALFTQRRFQSRVERDFRAAIAPAPENLFYSRGARDLREQPFGRAAQKMQFGAARRQIVFERRQGAVEPPAARPARRAQTGAFLVKHIKAEQRQAARRRRRQSGMVGDAEVVAEPDEGGRLRHGAAGRNRQLFFYAEIAPEFTARRLARATPQSSEDRGGATISSGLRSEATAKRPATVAAARIRSAATR